MRILVGCEESQAVTIELRKLGHEAYSCDVIDCSGGHPEWHIKGDVLEQLNKDWDMIIAFPPCTFLSNAGAARLFPNGKLNTERYQKGLKAKEFFMQIYNANCNKIAIENPVPSKIYGLPGRTQIIQPYYFGDEYLKRTCLWLRGLPKLIHSPENNLFAHKTHIEPKFFHVRSSSNYKSQKYSTEKAKGNQKQRSKTFPGIAKAMAEQWTV